MLSQTQIIPAALSNCLKWHENSVVVILLYIETLFLRTVILFPFISCRVTLAVTFIVLHQLHDYSDFVKENFPQYHLSTGFFNSRNLCLKLDAWNLHSVEARLFYDPRSLYIAVILPFDIQRGHLTLSFAEVCCNDFTKKYEVTMKFENSNSSTIRSANCILKQRTRWAGSLGLAPL